MNYMNTRVAFLQVIAIFEGKILSEDYRFKKLSKEPLCEGADPTHFMSFEHIDPALTHFPEDMMDTVRKLYVKLAYNPKMAGIFPPHPEKPGPYYGFREVCTASHFLSALIRCAARSLRQLLQIHDAHSRILFILQVRTEQPSAGKHRENLLSGYTQVGCARHCLIVMSSIVLHFRPHQRALTITQPCMLSVRLFRCPNRRRLRLRRGALTSFSAACPSSLYATLAAPLRGVTPWWMR
jgi:hypothetical protein